jgi:phi13 family phage major tail protein
MAANTQRLRIGASDFVYAIMNESTDIVGGTPTWGTVTSCPNTKSVAFDPGSSLFTGFYDDGAKFSADTVGVLKMTVNFGDLSPTNEAALLGHTYTNGQIQQKTTDQSPYVAVGWKTLRLGTNSGTAIYDYYWLYKGKARKPSLDAQTKAETISPADVVLEFNFVGLLSQSGLYSNKLRTDDDAAAAATISGFFTTVPLPSANLNALSVVAAEVGTSGTIGFTFSKAGGASFSMDSSTPSNVTMPVYVAGVLKAGSYSTGSAGTTVVVTFTPTVAFGGTDTATVCVTAGAKDTSGVGCTPYSVQLTGL